MNALAIYVVNAHLADLLAEAQTARLVRKPKGPGLVASVLAALRGTPEPRRLPKLEGYPHRG